MDLTTAWHALFSLRFPNGFVCPSCGERSFTLLARRGLCQCRACRRQTSLTSGTAFHRCRLSAERLLAVLSAVEAGTSARALQRTIGGSYRTAWSNAHKARRALHPTAREAKPTANTGVLVVPRYALRDDGDPVAVHVDLRRPTMDVIGPTRDEPPSSLMELGLDVANWLFCVFHGVSRKYLQRYLDAAAASLADVEVGVLAMAGRPCSSASLAAPL